MKENSSENPADFEHVIQSIPAFEALDTDATRQLAKHSEMVRIERGQHLITKGGPAQDMFVVLRGKFRAMNGTHRLSEINKGDTVGEIALFAGGTRTADVIATRQSDVMRITKEGFESVASIAPSINQAIISALAKVIVRTSDKSTTALAPETGQTVGLLPMNGAAISSDFVSTLAAGQAGDWRIVQTPEAKSADLNDWLAEIDSRGGKTILICTDPSETPDWADAILQNSDTIFAVYDAQRDPAEPLSDLEEALFKVTSPEDRQIVLMRPTSETSIKASKEWKARCPASLHHQIAANDAASLRRLARFIDSNPLGLILSGGGAFGTAHMGVIKALLEVGVEFDYVGGTSMGAAMAAAYAMGRAPNEVIDVVETIFVKNKAMSRLAVPRFGLIAHHDFDEQLKIHFEGLNVEDLPIGFFCVTTNLSYNEMSVVREGPLWEAVRKSTSIPAIFPPFVDANGEVFIDGALMDNSPIATMHQIKPGPNLVLDFYNPAPWIVRAKYADLPKRIKSLTGMLRRGKNGRMRFPSIFRVLSRTMVLNSHYRQQDALRATDISLVLRPIRGMGFLDWKKGKRQFEHAYELVRELLSEMPVQQPDCSEKLLQRLSKANRERLK